MERVIFLSGWWSSFFMSFVTKIYFPSFSKEVQHIRKLVMETLLYTLLVTNKPNVNSGPLRGFKLIPNVHTVHEIIFVVMFSRAESLPRLHS